MEKVSSFMDTDMEEHNDPFSFIMDGSQISHSQEELLRHQPFFDENVNQPSPPSTTSGADPIIMMSMPQTQPTEKNNFAPKDQDNVSDVLKFILQNSKDDDDENLSLLEECKKRGLSFPRPRWWPENDDSFRSGRIV